VKNHAAHQLNIEMTLTQGSLRGFAHHGEGVWQYIVLGLAGIETGAQHIRLGAQLVIRQGLVFGFQRVCFLNRRAKAADDPIVGAAEKLAGDRSEH
jgi:hypothetical protein